MQITIHRGTQQIGGSVIEIQSGHTRILLDAGLPLETRFDDAEVPSTLNPVGLSAILLTHAHPDHYGLIEQIAQGAPVYLTEGSSKALLASSLFAGTRSIPRERVQTVKPMEAFDVDPFSITPIPVDHSAFDAVAYSIQAEGKHILYTGDLRAHGRKPGMLHQLKRYCQKNPVDLMVTEGTRISEPGKNSLSEADVESQFRDIYTNAAGLVLNWFSPLNVDRWVSAYRALGKHRCFVHDLYIEFLHYLIKSQVPAIPLEREAKNLRVYCPPNQAKRLEYKGIRNFVEKTKLKIEFDLTQAIHPPENASCSFAPVC